MSTRKYIAGADEPFQWPRINLKTIPDNVLDVDAPPHVKTKEPTLEDDAMRKQMPMAEGLFAYFPDALAYVSHVSFLGNQKHNPGEPLHWSRGKSNDHLDCVARHLAQAGGKDAVGVRHSGSLAWRALANLQLELEAAGLAKTPRNAK